jgi:toxin-antitoxin system PIN domain toxin
VIAVDSNILVYSHREESPFYQRAFESIRVLAEGNADWAIPWPCLHEFLSVVTNPRIYQPATPLEIAFQEVDAWLESPHLALLTETDHHWAELRAVAIAGKIAGSLIHDARIAALCRQHGVRELWTVDRDFSRFPDLKVFNPLVG